MIAYFNGNFLEKDQIHISPDERAFLFADGIYEVVRSYEGRLFEFDTHLERLRSGLNQLRIEAPGSHELRNVATRLISENGLEAGDATVYFQITRGAAPRTHYFPPAGTKPTVYAVAKPIPIPSDIHRKGQKAILTPDQRWARCDIKSTGLLPNVLANQKAKEAGAFEALFVRDGVILEGSHTNVFFVKGGTLITAPLTNYILPGVTRKVVLALAGRLSIPIEERPFFADELPAVNEVFLSGTTTEILPLAEVGEWVARSGVPGAVTQKLQTAFQELVKANTFRQL